MQYRYRVVCGSYRDQKGMRYGPNDIVVSHSRLDLRFKNAFETLDVMPDTAEVVPTKFTPPRWGLERRGGRYHVRNQATGKRLTEKTITRAQADQLDTLTEQGYWIPPTVWTGGTVFIVGGGPSVKDLDLSFMEKKHVIGVNDSFLLGEWVDVCFFGDFPWLAKHSEKLAAWAGLRVTSQPKAHGIPGIHSIRRREQRGFGPPHQLGWYKNSGAASVCLAVRMGAAKIVLVGFDMKLSKEGDSNWHPNNLTLNNAETYCRFCYNFECLRLDLSHAHPKVQIFNANPDSGLEIFPKLTYNEACHDL